MSTKILFLGESELKVYKKKVEGHFVEIENETFYKISNVDEMPDFFMTIVSDSNHWMFLSSNGSLSAGRKNRDNALFPYYTDDKIHDYKNKTGSKTFCIVEKNKHLFWWEPFTDESAKVYHIERNLYKSIYGNKIIFEECNYDLGVVFNYGWYNSEKYGWIKKSGVSNLSGNQCKVKIVDGIQNLLPYGVDYTFQNEYSNLLDAYKKNELLEKSRLGLFMLSSIPVDRAEPSEALKATTVWSIGGNEKSKVLLSEKQIKAFKKGEGITTEYDVRASRGAYFLYNSFVLEPEEKQKWLFAAEINQDSADVANLNHWLTHKKNIAEQVNADILNGTKNLQKIVGAADGIQTGNEKLGFARHFSNTLFNVMRGGIFANNYTVHTADFKLYLQQTNKPLAKKYETVVSQLPAAINYPELIKWAQNKDDADLERIALEYLPLTFSRRHGDPSRPWNVFSIETKNNDGTNKLNYQGNWRDIFQNWEALSLSYPGFLSGMICKFLNASTADGYNPYRITREGIDWESPNPDEPWAFIGYWGDHQIIYLQKLLELSNKFYPGELDNVLTKKLFVYANVPYRIKTFESIKSNPKNTIDFDAELNKQLIQKAKKTGADGRMLFDKNGNIYHVNLIEKILVTLLAKLSNFVPEAGIWLNTQRPEWNDANNALVGNGASMVTLNYIRRFLSFWKNNLEKSTLSRVEISVEVKVIFDKIYSLFAENIQLAETGFSDNDRYFFTKQLGLAGSNYRQTIYRDSFSGRFTQLSVKELIKFITLALQYTDQSIQKNIRTDGLFHSYNLISIKQNSISIRYLYEMLEGQVAVLSSGFLSAKQSLSVLDSLKASKLFREDQYSYILYPDRQLKRFTEKNNIPHTFAQNSKLISTLTAENETSILKKDKLGNYHFNGAIRNAMMLSDALDKLTDKKYLPLVEKEKQSILDVYETIFDHQSFTGRSGTFYGYEGLGSIYWHMVSKLLLAVQECFFNGRYEGTSPEILGQLKQHYYEIKAGIGLYKSPELYGAFPTDAYSHTPGGAGAKQPGLTGQVKEDVISRFGELGLHVNEGKITFDISLLNQNELLKNPEYFNFFNLKGEQDSLKIGPNQLVFTFCQIPVIYSFSNTELIRLTFQNNNTIEIQGNAIDPGNSFTIFSRSGEIIKIEVVIKQQN